MLPQSRKRRAILTPGHRIGSFASNSIVDYAKQKAFNAIFMNTCEEHRYRTESDLPCHIKCISSH